MRYVIVLLAVFLTACDYGSFDKDKRQIMAKDYVREHLPPHATDFDITAFREDTLNSSPDSNFKRPIGYMLDYHFTDSTGRVQEERTVVVFTPDGHSIVNAIKEP
jgi:hypothetical protein